MTILPSWLEQILVCPGCHEALTRQPEAFACGCCGRAYPVRDGVVSFVAGDGYATSFGRQWNAFRRTQIDRFSNTTESRDRFTDETRWAPADLEGRLVLDGGCGAGRFADIALQSGARVVAVDISSAVSACRRNLDDLGHDPERFAVIQASLYELPFRPGTFDHAYSLGVIQHTPDRQRSVRELARQVSGGQLALWVYERSWRSLAGYKYWLRPFTSRVSEETNWKISRSLVKWWFPLAWQLSRVPRAGRYLVRFLPMAFREAGPDGTREQSREWSLLDTFDNLSPRYDNPITEAELRRWLTEAGMPVVTRLPAPGLAVVASRDPGAAVR